MENISNESDGVPEHIKLGAVKEVSDGMKKDKHTYTTMIALLSVCVMLLLTAVMLIYTRCGA